MVDQNDLLQDRKDNREACVPTWLPLFAPPSRKVCPPGTVSLYHNSDKLYGNLHHTRHHSILLAVLNHSQQLCHPRRFFCLPTLQTEVAGAEAGVTFSFSLLSFVYQQVIICTGLSNSSCFFMLHKTIHQTTVGWFLSWSRRCAIFGSILY